MGKPEFFFNKIKIDVILRSKTMRIKISGDVTRELRFTSPTKLNEGVALLAAHIWAVPFRVQAKNCTVLPELRHSRMETVVEIFKANMATNIMLQRNDYQHRIHEQKLSNTYFELVKANIKTMGVPFMPQKVGLATSAGNKSLLSAHMLRDVQTEYYTVNKPNFLTTTLLRVPLQRKRPFIYAPDGWHAEYHMSLPWRLFILAAAADRVGILFFGDDFKTSQAIVLSKKANNERYPFFTGDFDHSVFMSGLLNWAIDDFTSTRVSSLISNLCELQIQGIFEANCERTRQISCVWDTRWCCDCVKCHKLSLMLEALRGDNYSLPRPTRRTLTMMTPTRMWAYCSHLRKRTRYRHLPSFTPGQDSLELLRQMIYKRRGYTDLLKPISTEFLTQRFSSKTVPIIQTPYDAWVDKELLRFKGKVDALLRS